MATSEELYLTGLHLEQYRHATRLPETYWLEALRRDPQDARCNNAMGLLLLRRGQFAAAEEHFRKAIGRLTERNPNRCARGLLQSYLEPGVEGPGVLRSGHHRVLPGRFRSRDGAA
jgi:tetratricopeptide (TPR) repeat protein